MNSSGVVVRPQGLDERIALIRSVHSRNVASAIYRATVCFCNAVLAAYHFTGSMVSLLFRCVVTVASIPSYIAKILFSRVPPPLKEAEKREFELNDWLSRVLTPLTSSEKLTLNKAVKGFLRLDEEEKLTEELLAKKRATDLNEADFRTLFGNYLQRAKAAAAKEKARAVSLSPLDQIKERQRIERTVILELGTKLKLIDQESITKRIDPASEAPYLRGRAEFIQAELIDFDRENLWGECNNEEITLDAVEALEERLKDFQEGISGRYVDPSDSLLANEYCALLRQRLSLSSDLAKWHRYLGQVDDLNKTTRGAVVALHDAIRQRWADAASQFPALREPTAVLLKGMDPLGDITKYFQQALSLMDQLHQRETQILSKESTKIPDYFLQTGGLFALKDLESNVDVTVDVAPRKELLSIRDSKERKKARAESVSKEFMYACIERTPDGQQLFHLMRRLSSSEEDKELKKVCEETLQALFIKNKSVLLEHMYSTAEYAFDIGGAEFQSLVDARRMTRGHDLEALGKKLDLGLSQWYRVLQGVWINGISFESEREVEAIKGRTAQTKKMAQLFARWMLEKTSLPFVRVLSFDHIRLANEERKRLAALATITRYAQSGKLDVHKHKKDKAAESPSIHEFHGFPIDSILLDRPSQTDPSVAVESFQFSPGAVGLAAPPNLVQRLKRSDAYDAEAQVRDRMDRLTVACREPIGLDSEILFRLGSFFDIARYLTAPAPQEFLDAFVALVLDPVQSSFQKENFWRQEVLQCYLQMVFKGRGTPVKVSEEQRKYLIQFATLAEFPLPELNVVAMGESNLRQCHVEDLGQALQASDIGLEGLEEGTLERSLQASQLPRDPHTRRLIDALRARSGEEAPKQLLSAVFAAYPMEHDQGQEAISRALFHAFKGPAAGGVSTFFQGVLLNTSPITDEINPVTMALPDRVFILDCCITMRPDLADARAQLEAFDDQLIQSNNSTHMVMGFARKIHRLSQIFMTEPTDANFAELLKLKIAYQALKRDHIDGKIRVEGFLKVAIDRAEHAMAISACQLQRVAAKDAFNPNEIARLICDSFNPDPAFRTYTENTLEKVFRSHLHGRAINFRLPGFFNFGPTDIDIVTGAVYFGGMQRLELPAHLQNHPHIRSLHLHDLPYNRNADGSFSHYTVEGDVQIPQVLVVLDTNGNLIIQRNLPTSFGPERTVKSLQYLSVEQFDAIPTAIADRMGAEQFWIDAEGMIYGYSERGDLIVSFNRELKKIKTTSGEYRFPRIGDVFEPSINPVLTHLKGSLSFDEILMKEDGTSFWIPALDLTISLEKDGDWHCVSPTISGMVLDLSEEPRPSVLVLKREGKPKSTKMLEDQLILLKKRLEDAEAIEGHSLSLKGRIIQLKKQIVETEVRLTQTNPRLYMAVLPGEEGAPIRQELKIKIRGLVDISRSMMMERNPDQSRKLRTRYLTQEKEHRELQEKYEAKCRTKRQAVLLDSLKQDCITGRDLAGLLFLLSQALGDQEEVELDSVPWIQEIGKHLPNDVLPEKALMLLSDVVGKNTKEDELALYLALISSQNFFLRLQQARTSLARNKSEMIADIERRYIRAHEQCLALSAKLIREGKSFCLEVRSLLQTHCPGTLAFGDHMLADVASTFPQFSQAKLQGVSSQSLMERLALKEHVVSVPKDPATEIPEAQKKLLNAFTPNSPDQVAGFYLEEFGMFSVASFYQLFGLNRDGEGEALFGLQRENLEQMFESLKASGLIERRGGVRDFYYSVTTKMGNPLFLAETDALLTGLAHLPLPPEVRREVADRLRIFMFQAAGASFSFSWKSASVARDATAFLMEEQEKHRLEVLDAEFFLQKHLESENVTLTEFKRRVLTGNGVGVTAEARNALIRFLVHKTEYQHITNTLKAPLKGERNQIELLSTARQYSIDLLFREAKDEVEREAQIMQLAFLLFEEDYGARCNPMQIKLFRSLMLDPRHPEATDAMQARMGFGKTALLPLMALVEIAKQAILRPEARSLVRYVVPKAVLQDNAYAFQERISHILGANVLKDRDFPRYQINPADKVGSFRQVIADLQLRFQVYDNARREGIPLIQWPEIRQSMEAQELAFGFLLIDGDLNEDARTLCFEAKQLLGEIRSMATYTVFDELDATQDFKACEVNFTEGKKLPIHMEAIRPLTRLIDCVGKNSRDSQDVLVVKMLQAVALDHTHEELIKYVTDPREARVPFLGALNEEQRASIFLIRAILLDPNIFAFVCNKQPNTHFGVRFTERDGKRAYSFDPESGSALLIAVPYEGTNTPKGLSTFDNTEVSAITTLRYYASGETMLEKEPHLEFLVTQTQKGTIPRSLEDGVPPEFIQRLRHLSELLDKAEIEQAKQLFYRDFLANPTPAVRTYFGMAVVAAQVRTDEGRANSNRYEMGSPADCIKGCSGTVSSTSSYFVKPAIDPAADGKLSLEIMGRENNAPVAVLDAFNEGEGDYLEQVLDSLLRSARADTRAIVDAAGICKSRDGNPETIVKSLWVKLQAHPEISGIEGIVYYGRDNVKRLYRGPTQPPIPCRTDMELGALSGKKYFSFYGQKNTRGSDIKQADGAHALVTMDENVPNSDAKQAVLRFRSLVQRSSGQTFTFALTTRFHEMLVAKRVAQIRSRARRVEGDDTNIVIDAKYVSIDLREKEKKQEEKDALLLFRKELSAHVKQAAAHFEHRLFSKIDLSGHVDQQLYTEFLRRRDQITPLLEKALDELEHKYGAALRDEERDEFIERELNKFRHKLEELIDLSHEMSGRLRLNNVQLDEQFFYERIDASRRLFESRYPADSKVKIAAVDTGAEAVAMALAQAQAEALAEALAEQINETVVHALDRIPQLKVTMARAPHFSVDPAWVTNPTGVPINGLAQMKYLVHPELRDIIQISPQLQREPLVSHFALIPKTDANPPIFISQDEAEAWLRISAAGGASANYDLIDLRNDDQVRSGGRYALAMQCAVLQRQEPIPAAKDTASLRALALENVTTPQLLPALHVRGVSDVDVLTQVIDLTTFGISREGEIPLSLAKADSKFVVEARGAKVKIPTKNEWLQPIFARVGNTPGKLERMQRSLESDSVAFRQQLIRLRAQQAELQTKQVALNRKLEDVSQFRVDAAMEFGLRERDKEFVARRELPECVRKCGDLFIRKMNEIVAAQETLKRGGPAQAAGNLAALQGCFREFVSLGMSEYSGSFNEAVFDKAHWETNYSSLPPFDLVYGRILHSVHGSAVIGQNGAKNCVRQDCNRMFNYTLPTMRGVVNSMQKAAQDLPGIVAEIQIIEAEIGALLEKERSLKEAEDCLKAMARREITEVCAQGGVQLEPASSDAPALFWDRFNFAQFETMADFRMDLVLRGTLPEHCTTVVSNIHEYERRIRALSEKEVEIRNAHQQLARTAQQLASRIEPRAHELACEAVVV